MRLSYIQFWLPTYLFGFPPSSFLSFFHFCFLIFFFILLKENDHVIRFYAKRLFFPVYPEILGNLLVIVRRIESILRSFFLYKKWDLIHLLLLFITACYGQEMETYISFNYCRAFYCMAISQFFKPVLIDDHLSHQNFSILHSIALKILLVT